jgi:Leucine-rich repeat (LRR) protein
MKKFIQWVMAATLVCGSSLFTACVTDVVDNPVPPEKTIAIDKANFPDDNFREYLLNQDYGQDGVLTETEIMFIDDMDVYDMEISSLQGIEYFTALTVLDCEDNELTTLDISKNTALVKLYCSMNYLTSLDITNNVALKRLSCYDNELTSLDVSKNTALTFLDCEENKITALDVSMCTELESLTCGDNELTQLDISNLTYLESLNCYYNNLTTLDVSNNPNLEYINCENNQLSSLDISNNPNLGLVFCDGNQISSLDFTNNPLLYFVSLTRNKISGQNMDNLISSLLQYTETPEPIIDLIDYSEGDEENVCTKTQVAAIKAKGWKPRYYNEEEDEWTEYEGSDE